MSRPAIAAEPILARTEGWADYGLIDSGGGRKLERYGRFRVVRPEPQCLWTPSLPGADWDAADAVFDPSAGDEEAGHWRLSTPAPPAWPLSWGGVTFNGRFAAFRHLAFFPEQAANWAWLQARIEASARPLKILNLFGYTGVASLVCAAAGATVTHVDASKKSVGWARENAALSGLDAAPIRWICEDARKYAAREVKRGSLYDGIILDPPKYGRGPEGEVWRLYEHLPELMSHCGQLLAPDASFLLLNAYAERISGLALAGLTAEVLDGRGGRIDWGELALMEEGGARGVGLSFFAPVDRMIREITSLANPTVKAVRALHMRKERQETGLFLAEGLKIITEAVELGHAPKTLLYVPESPIHPLLLRAIEATSANSGEVVEVTPAILGKIARRDNPQAVLGVFEQKTTTLASLVPASAPCWVGLEMVRDPGNLGTIIRTADAAGCGAVILIGECCDPWSVEAVRASMGSIFATPVVRATTAEFLAWREAWPGSVIATLLSARTDYREADYQKPSLILMGNEQQGLTVELVAACDVAVKIPMRGRADSLNLAVATGVMIYAVG